jgi:GT2 family glycosyltransferase
MDETPNLGSAAGLLLRIETIGAIPTTIDSVGLFMRRNRRQGLLLDGASIEQAPTESRPIFGPDGAAAFYRRAMLEDIAIEGEIFDEDFFIHKEDVDICWRAQLAGWTSIYVPTAIAHHIRTFRPGKRDHIHPYLRQCAVRNRYLLMLKNETPSLFRRDFLRIILYDVLVISFILLREWSSLTGLTSAWLMRQRIIRKRRVIQTKRRVSADKLEQLFI